mgnify:FL=1
MKKMLAILLALIMVFALVACSVDGETEDSKKAEDAAPAADAEATPDAEEEKAEDASSKPEATASSEDIFVGISINALDAINNQQTFEMMQAKCEAAGFKYSATNANGDAVQQSTDIENLVQMGCNYIVVLNGDTDGLTGTVQEAVSKGVKVISVESGYIDGISAYFAKNDFALGSAMYMMLASEMGYQGQIICTGHTGHPAIRARVDVQEAMLKEYTGIEMVTFVTTGYPGTTELAYNGCETALQQYPDVKSIWCTFDLEALGAAQACEDLGMDDVKIIGTDGELDVLYMIKEGKHIIATSVADLEATTDDVVATINELHETGTTEMFHEMPFIFITKDNVDEYIASTEAYLKKN